MRATILIDNISNDPALIAEWGLSIYIEHNGRRFLLDTGAGPDFARNAETLGIDLRKVEFGILSHAHYDHADGMDTFFELNASAPFYLREGSAENCYDKKEADYSYIGIRQGILKDFAHRIRFAEGVTKLTDDVYLLPHSTPGLDTCGKRFAMYQKQGDSYVFDDFCHEQSLIFDTENGLVIFNSCCHGGADVIIREAAEAFPGKKLHAIVGGFHLFETPPEEVGAFGHRLLDTGVEHVVTGHCTGQEAFDILKEILGDRAVQTETGLQLTF